MAAITQNSKIKIKRSTISGVVPTIGLTADHTDGSWSDTDIYVGEYFYNVIDNRLWIGGVDGIAEILIGQVFELTYAEAELQKTITGRPQGDGLIIGAIYKITDRGDNGLMLTAIDVDKFSNYCDELIASPEEHIPALYDFDNDLLTYPPSTQGYIELKGRVSQEMTNAPTVVETINEFGTYSLSRLNTGEYQLTTTSSPLLSFAANKVDFSYCNSDSAAIVSPGQGLIMTWSVTSATTIKFTTHRAADGAMDDDLLFSVYFSILLYN